MDSLFSIFLHACIDGGIDFQTIGIDVIRFTVAFEVLIAPSVKRVLLPSNGVDDILAFVPVWISIALRFLGHHILAQELAEIVG